MNLWGLTLKGDNEGILYSPWNSVADEPRWDGEPVWPLLFRTRRQAIAWKRNAEKLYAYLGWKFRVVRVRMALEPLR